MIDENEKANTFPMSEYWCEKLGRAKNYRLDMNQLQKKLEEIEKGEIKLEELKNMVSNSTIPNTKELHDLDKSKEFQKKLQENYKTVEVFF